MEYQMRNWYYYNWLCGDHIVEQHIHNLDVGNWLMKANPLTGEVIRSPPRAWGADRSAPTNSTAKSTTITPSNMSTPTARGCSANAGTCRVVLDNVTEHAPRHQRGCGSGWPRLCHYRRKQLGNSKAKYRDPYQVEHDDLFAAIRSGTPYNEAENGAYSTLTAIIGRMATYSGKEIKWDQALNSDISLMPKDFAWDAAPPTLPNENGEYPIAIPG